MRLEGDRPGPDQMGPAAKLRSQALTLRAVGLEQGSDAIQVFKNVLQRLESRSKGGFSVLPKGGFSVLHWDFFWEDIELLFSFWL